MTLAFPTAREGAALVEVDECWIYASDCIVGLWQPLTFERERDCISDPVMAALREHGADLGLEPMLLSNYDVAGKAGFTYVFARQDA